MASVYHFLSIMAANFLGSAFPQLKNIAGTNFPVMVLAFDAATEEKAYWKLKARNYGSGNVTVNLTWAADTATSGDVVWGCRLAAVTPDSDTQDITTKAFASQQTVTDSHLGTTAKRAHKCSITISTNIDGLADQDEVWLEISRLGNNGSDTMAGDALLTQAEISYSDT